VVSACCPEDAGRRVMDSAMEKKSGEGPRLTVHQDQREEIRAGEDRVFRYMVHTDVGCKEVTQFVGMIPQSKAPFHTHEYEEGIFILAGRGILHLHGPKSSTAFGAGDSIYLPRHTAHCLENPGPEAIRLLGVFHPSGSPGAAYEKD
jgi:mannose-6-phosphate isomerase-like protein (cupin superfamily)